MDPLILSAAAASALLGAGLSRPLERFARRRALAQPVDVDLDAERLVLQAALANPAWIADGAELSPGEFAEPAHQLLWAAMRDLHEGSDSPIPPGALFTEDITAALERRLAAGSPVAPGSAEVGCGVAGPDAVSPGLLEHLALDEPLFERARQALFTVSQRRELSHEQYLKAGELVMAAFEDRTEFCGPCQTLQAPDGSWVRCLPPLARRRSVVTAGITIAGFAAAPWLAAAATTSVAAWAVATTATLLLVSLSMLVALTDIDTLRIDFETFFPLGAFAWLLSGVAAWLDGRLGDVGWALAVVGAVVLLFEGMNAVFHKLKGQQGQGFGDTLLAIVSVGVPVALSGEPLVGYWAVMCAAAGALSWFAIRRLRGTDHAQARLNAFGPFLAGGGLAGWVLTAVGVPGLW
jgi:prepilin signal peptidase PulO-like enzyme (type II secretory pathway)